MKKITQAILILVFMCMCLCTTVYATSNETSQGTLKSESTGKLLEIKKHELSTMEDYKEKYGSDTYGVTAYIIGLKKLDVRDKGFNNIIAIITIGVICQILPIIFAIVVTSAGKQ